MEKIRDHKIIARAGCGKTATMIKIAVETAVRNPKYFNKLLMVTFTNAGVNEFKERISRALEPLGISCDCMITTFHGLALEICKKFYEELGFSRPPKEVNEVDKARIVSSLVTTKKISGPEELYKLNWEGILNIVAYAIQLFDKVGEHEELLGTGNEIHEFRCMLSCADDVTDSTVQELLDIYPKYCEELKKENIILFSDMERMQHQILDAHPEFLEEEYGFKYFIFDEAQDMSEIQMRTVKKLLDMPTKVYSFTVGDDNQSIYMFRDADVTNFVNYEENLGKEVKQFDMLENWRSVPPILELADAVVALNEIKTEGKTLAGRESNGKKPIVRGFHTDKSEYEYIVSEVIKNTEKGTPLSRQCIICYSNKELLKCIEYLAAKGIPYVLKNPMKFIENSRVKAVLAFLENVYWQPETNAGYATYLGAKYNGDMLEIRSPHEIVEEIEELQSNLRNIEALDLESQKQIIHKYLDDIRGEDEIYESWLDDYVYKYADLAEELKFVKDFRKFGGKMAKRMAQNYEGIVLTTAHSSKGLEWDIVYNSLSGYDNQLFHRNKYKEELEERRRLLYVSMTRAREMLYVTGRFVVDGTKSRKEGPCYNQFIKDLYNITGQVYDPIDHVAEAFKRAKQQEAYKRSKERQAEKYAQSNSSKSGNKVPKGTYLGTQTSIYDFIPVDDPNMAFKPAKPEKIYAD